VFFCSWSLSRAASWLVCSSRVFHLSLKVIVIHQRNTKQYTKALNLLSELNRHNIHLNSQVLLFVYNFLTETCAHSFAVKNISCLAACKKIIFIEIFQTVSNCCAAIFDTSAWHKVCLFRSELPVNLRCGDTFRHAFVISQLAL